MCNPAKKIGSPPKTDKHTLVEHRAVSIFGQTLWGGESDSGFGLDDPDFLLLINSNFG